MAVLKTDDDEFRTNSDVSRKRLEVMDEKQIALANKYLDFYRSAYQDKDNRGLFDKWETIDLYWEGEANPPESDTDPGSNTNIINANIEGQVAYLVDQNIAITTKGRGPSDVPFADTARVLLEFVKEQNKMKRKLDVHERRREKFGVGIFRVLFDPDALDGMGLPLIEPCNPAYVFPDPNITNIYKIQEGRFLIEVVNKSISWARDHYDEDLVDAIEPGHDPLETMYIFGEEDGETDEISQDHYLHMFVWTRHKGEMRLVEMSGCGIILRDTAKKKVVKERGEDEEGEEEEQPVFPKNIYPYFFTPDMFREGTVWAKSTAELLINTQDLIDDIDDQIRINARLTGNPQRLVLVESGIDPDKLTNEGSLAIPTNVPKGIEFLQPPTMPQYIINRRDQAIGLERQIVTRFGDQQTGVKQQGVDTATEALSLQQSANVGITHKKILLEETLSEVFEYCLELIKEYWTEEEAFRVTEKNDQFIFFRPSKLKGVPKLIPASDSFKQNFMASTPNAVEAPPYMPLMDGLAPVTKDAAFDITVNVGAGLPQNKAFVYTLIKEAYAAKIITAEEFRKLLIDFTGLPVDEKPPMPPMMPQMPGVQPQAPNPMVAGLSQAGNPALSVLQGGGM